MAPLILLKSEQVKTLTNVAVLNTFTEFPKNIASSEVMTFFATQLNITHKKN